MLNSFVEVQPDEMPSVTTRIFIGFTLGLCFFFGHSTILANHIDEINEKGKLSDELAESLTGAIEAYKTIYRFSFGG